MTRSRRHVTGPDRRRRATRDRRTRTQEERRVAVDGSTTDESCSCGCGQQGVIHIDDSRLIEEIDALWTPEDQALTQRCHDAEARGDAQAALDAYVQTLRIQGDAHLAALTHLADLADQVPEWLMARWVRSQAFRWMLIEADPRLDPAVREVLGTHVITEVPTARWYREYGTRVLGSDVLCEELALHRDGGLADFIDLHASDDLLERAGQVREWADAPLAVHELREVDAGVLTVRERASGIDHRTLHLGATAGREFGDRVLGRLVPIDTAPGLMFERRPITVEPIVADLLVDVLATEPEHLMTVLSDAVQAGLMLDRPGTRVSTSMWSDLVREDRVEQ